MPQRPKLRQKNGYWYTGAGNPSGEYFGRVGVVGYEEAKRRYAEHLKKLSAVHAGSASTLSVLSLCEHYLDWVQAHRGERSYDERKRHLTRFCNYRIGMHQIASLSATDVRASDLQEFLVFAKAEFGLDEFTCDKHATSVKAAFNWGARNPSPDSFLPAAFRPFSSIEKYRRPMMPMRDSDLMTPEEIERLLNHADDDLAAVYENGKKRKRRPDEFRHGHANPYSGFADMLRCYWHTGARTSELAHCEVRDFVRRSKQIIPSHHKRMRTMKVPVARQIVLNEEAYQIVLRCCEGKRPTDRIFIDPKARPWTRLRLAARFKEVRRLAGVRDDVTIYSFRHLWISEALMSGIDPATVAKMAGTSIAMIERVYGHFTAQHMLNAQSQLEQARRNRKQSA